MSSAPRNIGIDVALDSGCTWHCTNRKADLINFRSHHQILEGINKEAPDVTVTGIGDLPIIVKDADGNRVRLTLRNVRYSPDFTDMLASVDQFWDELKGDVRFKDIRQICFSKHKAAKELRGVKIPFVREGGLSILKAVGVRRLERSPGYAKAAKDIEGHFNPANVTHGASSKSFVRVMRADDVASLLHRRLHLGIDKIRKLPDCTADVPASAAKGHLSSCDACLQANATRLPHSGSKYKKSYVGKLIHGDIVGPFRRSMIGGYQYMLVLTDDHSRFKSVHFMQKKSEAIKQVRKFVARLNRLASTRTGKPVRIVGHLHVDNAGEFLSHEFKEFLDSELIDQTTCPAYVHDLNGVAERSIRSIVENMRSHIAAANMPPSPSGLMPRGTPATS